MKAFRYIVFGLIIVLGLFGVWLWQTGKSKNQNKSVSAKEPSASVAKTNNASKPKVQRTPDGRIVADDSRLGPYAGLSAEELWKRKPKMEKSKFYPPETPEEIGRWQWFRAMLKADPVFEAKTPIEFYGKVVDQNGEPVSGAQVDMNWTVVGGNNSKQLKTRNDGLFELTGVEGKFLSLFIYQQGYLPGKQSHGGYEYGDFSNQFFHIPDPNNPVVFTLWKLGDSEPMYLWYLSRDLTVDGRQLWINVKNGKDGEIGDIGFSVVRHDPNGDASSGYTLNVQVGAGAGIAMSHGEEFMFQAPEVGYEPFIQIEQKPSQGGLDTSFKGTQKLRFYVKTQDGKYAAVDAEIGQYNIPGAGLRVLIYYNPSGSRNLEFDDKKQINR